MGRTGEKRRTNDHGSKLKSLAYAFPMNLVWQVCETDVACQLFTDDRHANVVGLSAGRAGAIGIAVGVGVSHGRFLPR